MSVFHANALLGASGAGVEPAEHTISRSLRFNSGDSAYLDRTPSTAGNRKTWTWSGWVKRSGLGAFQYLFDCGSGSSPLEAPIRFWSDDRLDVSGFTSSTIYALTTTAKFRDTSAWYHIVVAFDTTNATADDRIKLYVNGSQITQFDARTNPSQNTDYYVNNTIQHNIGRAGVANNRYFDGYLADVHFIDGQALSPTDFGEYDSNNNWNPKAFSGTYGTNGFYLKFDDTSSDAALGTDSSGNNNTWTVNNIRAYPNLPYADYWTGTFLAGEPGENAFDGSPVTASRPDSSQTITWTPATSIPFTKLVMRAAKSGAGTNISVNGTDVTESFNPQNTVDITSLVSSPLTSISLTSTASERPRLFFVSVDDVVLISGHNTDSFIDTPTNYTAASGNNGGNYCTWNPLNLDSSGGITLSNGNLNFEKTTGGRYGAHGTIALPSTGKYYWEVDFSSSTNFWCGGLAQIDEQYGGSGDTWIYQYTDQAVSNGSFRTNNGDTVDSSGIVGFIYDANTGQLDFTDGTNTTDIDWSGYPISGEVFAFVGYTASTTSATVSAVANFGQRPFAYTPPTGYKSLCTTNLPDPTISDPSQYMDVALYTGNGSTQSITGLNFSPDFVWYKSRSNVNHHILENTETGAGEYLASSQTNAERTSTNLTTSFDSAGVSFGNNSIINGSGQTYVAWLWDGGSSTVSNTDGSITSSVRANPTAGFSIVTWTGTGTQNDSVGHGLNTAPELIITKNRSSASNWRTLLTAYDGSMDRLFLNANSAIANQTMNVPTSSVFYVGTQADHNASGDDIIAFCFAPVEQYSSMGVYTGNGSADGTFVQTNMLSRWIMIKRTNSTSNWIIIDTAREGYNVDNDPLYANLSNAEGTTDLADILSNGFKLRTTDASVNASAGSYVYLAFAENPLKTARAR